MAKAPPAKPKTSFADWFRNLASPKPKPKAGARPAASASSTMTNLPAAGGHDASRFAITRKHLVATGTDKTLFRTVGRTEYQSRRDTARTQAGCKRESHVLPNFCDNLTVTSMMNLP